MSACGQPTHSGPERRLQSISRSGEGQREMRTDDSVEGLVEVAGILIKARGALINGSRCFEESYKVRWGSKVDPATATRS